MKLSLTLQRETCEGKDARQTWRIRHGMDIDDATWCGTFHAILSNWIGNHGQRLRYIHT